MFSHGRGLTKLVMFYVLLLLIPGGYWVIALAAIGLMLGGTTRRELTDKERANAVKRHNEAAARWAAGEGREYAAALTELKKEWTIK